MNGNEQGRTPWAHLILLIVIIPGSVWPGSFFDSYQVISPFKTVLDDTARAWAYAQDLEKQYTRLSVDDYQGYIYTLVGMIACLHATVSRVPLQSIADNDKAYYMRIIQIFESDCYALKLTDCQRMIIRELFAAVYATLVQANNAKFSPRQYQSGYTYWQYPKKAIDRLQYRVC
jgi:hypothetical protein